MQNTVETSIKELHEIDNAEVGILSIMLGHSELEGVDVVEVSKLVVEELEDKIKGLQLQLREAKEMRQVLKYKLQDTETQCELGVLLERKRKDKNHEYKKGEVNL